MNLLFFSEPLAFVLGFPAHRLGICTVAAVAEVLPSSTAHIFRSFFKLVLWVWLVNGLLVLWMPDLARPLKAYPEIHMAIIGGCVFGVGATVNGGCSFSTISRIAQGKPHMALILPSFVLGVFESAGGCLRRASGDTAGERRWRSLVVRGSVMRCDRIRGQHPTASVQFRY